MAPVADCKARVACDSWTDTSCPPAIFILLTLLLLAIIMRLAGKLEPLKKVTSLETTDKKET